MEITEVGTGFPVDSHYYRLKPSRSYTVDREETTSRTAESEIVDSEQLNDTYELELAELQQPTNMHEPEPNEEA